MSLSDCPKCWDTPCTCGYEYETWTDERIRELHGVLGGLLQRRASGEPRRLGSWEQPRSPQAGPIDYGASISIPAEAIFGPPRSPGRAKP